MGKNNDQVVRQESEPWPGVQPYLANLYQGANNAFNQTNRNPYQGDLYAGPTGAQLMAQNGLIGVANDSRNMGQYAQQGLDQIAGFAQGQGFGSAGQGFNAMRNFRANDYYGATPQQTVGFERFQEQGAPQYGTYRPQGSLGQGAYPQIQHPGLPGEPPIPDERPGPERGELPAPSGLFDRFTPQQHQPTSNPTPQQFNFNSQGLMPTGAYGGVGAVKQGIDQIAGQDPNVQGGNLEAAIKAQLDPIQRNFQETILPDMMNQFVGAGTFDNSRAGFNVAKRFEQALSQPGQEVAANLTFQDYLRRQEGANQNYQLRTQLGAQAAENEANRRAQDLGALRGQQLAQSNLGNQLGLQNIGQLRDLDAQNAARTSQERLANTQMQNQYGMQDLMNLRGLSQEDTLNQRGYDYQDMFNLRGTRSQEQMQLNDLLAQQGMQQNQLRSGDYNSAMQRQLQDIMGNNQLRLNQAQGQNQIYAGDLNQLRGLQQQDTQYFNQLQQQDLNQRRMTDLQRAQMQMQAAGSLGGMEQGVMQNRTLPYDLLSQLGGQQQQWNQGLLNEGLQQYQMQNQAPWQGFSELTSILHGNPYSTSTQTSPGPSQMGQMLQGGIGGLGLGASLFPGAAKGIAGASGLGGMLGSFASGPLMPLAILGGLAGAFG